MWVLVLNECLIKQTFRAQLVYTLVFPFMPNTLAHLREELSGERNVLDIKLYIWQLFAGLEHLRKVGMIMKKENAFPFPAAHNTQGCEALEPVG